MSPVSPVRLLILAVILATTTAAAEETAPSPQRLPLMLSRHVALSQLPEANYKGGTMARLRDGRVMLVYAEKEVREPLGTSSLRAVFSGDGGASWGDAREILRDDRYNPGRPTLLSTRSGRLWLVYYGFVRVSTPPGSGNGHSWLWASSSDDDGQTWTDPVVLFEGYTGGQRGAIETSDGRIVVVFSHAALPDERNVSRSVVSVDGGETWHTSSALELPGQGSHSGTLEPAVLELKDGRLWMLIRHPRLLHQSFSTDGGMTWSQPEATELTTSRPSGGAPASVIRLSDGRIAIAWNPQTHVPPDPEPWQRLGRGTLAVAVSSGEGETWSDPVPVAQASFVCYPHLLEYEPRELLLSTGLLRAHDFKTDTIVLRFPAAEVFPQKDSKRRHHSHV